MPRSNNLNIENSNDRTSCTSSPRLCKSSADQSDINKAYGDKSNGPDGQHWLFAQYAESPDGGYTPRPLSPINSNASAVPSSRSLTPVAPNQAVSYNVAEHPICIVKDDVISSWLRGIDHDTELPVNPTCTATSRGNKTLHMGSGLDGPTSPPGETDDIAPSITTYKSFPWSMADDAVHPKSKHINSTTSGSVD